jgi:ABC-2 type transport system permease protein
MAKALAVCGRDLRSYLNTFSFYLLVMMFIGITGYFFWSTISYYSLLSFQASTNPAYVVNRLNLTEGVLSPFLLNMSALLLLMMPILSMRSLAEERKMGTLELLLSYPITDVQMVLGKFLALACLLAILIAPTITYFFIAEYAGARFEYASIVTGYAGLYLVGLSFLALGLFTSSLTDQQAVSAGLGFVVILFFWVVGWMAEWTSPALGSIFKELSLVEHFKDLTRGVVDTRDILFFVLFAVFFLFATLNVVETRSWRR